eukprot:CAMPEP_0117438898 /NCGR_PEP_ID=MMETSP0759-20121206/2292_1 /TAXON_ID=63605 /ORGANISM="Percolomonas cosmopolitus, Strain WS" /LENGTH=357 /DNA_ID=CAMNT_0005230607 /DNA_START=346 /DNA_END=1418 /DNA_ORIENTATION=-
MGDEAAKCHWRRQDFFLERRSGVLPAKDSLLQKGGGICSKALLWNGAGPPDTGAMPSETKKHSFPSPRGAPHNTLTFSAGNDWSRIGDRFFGDMRKADLFKRHFHTPFIEKAERIFETNYGLVLQWNEELYFVGEFGLLDDSNSTEDNEKWTRISRQEMSLPQGDNNAFQYGPTTLSQIGYNNTTLTSQITTNFHHHSEPLSFATAQHPNRPVSSHRDSFVFPVLSVAAGLVHALVVDSSHRVWVCGANDDFQLAHNDSHFHSDELVLLKDSPLNQVEIVQVACGKKHSLFLEAGMKALWMSGSNMNNQISTHPSVTCSPPIRIQLTVPLRRIGASQNVSLYLTREGALYAAGDCDW